MRKGLLAALLIILFSCLGFAAGFIYHQKQVNIKVLPILGHVPSDTFTNQLGQKVSTETFKGKIRVVTFLFPYCDEYCPLIALNMVELEQLLKEAHLTDKVQLVAYNVDPENTGTRQMSEFMQQYGWNPKDTHWQYLTGNPATIHSMVTGSYFVYYQRVTTASEDSVAAIEKKKGTFVPSPEVKNDLADKVNPDYDIVHNDALAIVDTKGRIRKIFDDADHVSGGQMLKVIQQILGH